MPNRPDDRGHGRDKSRHSHRYGGHGPGEDASWRSYADEAYENQARYGDYDYGGGHGGQEYGLEREGGGYGGARARTGAGPVDPWREEEALEAHYVAWRDEQLRAYDRDYAEWRAARSRRYDEEYRARRAARRERTGG